MAPWQVVHSAITVIFSEEPWDRRIEELISKSEQKIKESRNRLEDIKTAQSLLVDDIEANKAELQEQLILQNTAKMNVDRAAAQKNESENVYAGLIAEKPWDRETASGNQR